MEKSGLIMFVVTHSFLESEWGQKELEIAQNHVIDKKDSEILVIMKEDIAIEDMPDVLKNMWFKLACLKWPNSEDEAVIAKFWKRLVKDIRIRTKGFNCHQQV